MTGDEAIDIVARHGIARSAESFAEDGWDFYTGIGEHDWERVGERMKALAPYPSESDVDAAEKLLSARADHNVV